MKVKYNQYIRGAEMQIGFFVLWTGCLPDVKETLLSCSGLFYLGGEC